MSDPLTTWADYGVVDLFPGWLDEGFFPVELCEGGCGFGRSFCNCEAPAPIGG